MAAPLSGSQPCGCGIGLGDNEERMGGGCVLVPYRIGEVAERANVPEGFVRRLIDLGALPGEEAGLGFPEVRRSPAAAFVGGGGALG